MVAIIRCTEAETTYLEWQEGLFPASGRREWTWTTTRLREFWTKGSHITLIATPDRDGLLQVTRMGHTKRLRQVADLQQKLEISHVTLLSKPVTLSEVIALLATRHRVHLVEEGQQTEATGKALLTALVELRPDADHVIGRLRTALDGYTVRSKAGQALATQRDAVLGIGRMAGMSIPQLARWDPPAEELYDDSPPPAYLDLLSRAEAVSSDASRAAPQHDIAIEDHQIGRDAEIFLSWIGELTGHVAWRHFRQDGQSLLIANVNRTAVEGNSGADLLYYHQSRKSLILVQYKKLDRVGGYYYPDSDRKLADELERMQDVDAYAARLRQPTDDHRLSPDPSWIKLCPPEGLIPQANVMVPGMYFSRQHFQRLRDDPRLRDGRGGALRFGYSNVPSYLDNTMFTRLVETGMIGTAGVGTELVRQQITKSVREGRLLTGGLLTGKELPQSARNSARRRRRRK
ncbi:hypothetical protein [Streptomyces rimosus]|uniref:hypothetical protein n=1 Tax=Streptomyces rimosus TaxID=1927 RepID=UPI0004C55ABE|nr:hypothetical protein [Streptomyces rimosus]